MARYRSRDITSLEFNVKTSAADNWVNYTGLIQALGDVEFTNETIDNTNYTSAAEVVTLGAEASTDFSTTLYYDDADAASPGMRQLLAAQRWQRGAVGRLGGSRWVFGAVTIEVPCVFTSVNLTGARNQMQLLNFGFKQAGAADITA